MAACQRLGATAPGAEQVTCFHGTARAFSQDGDGCSVTSTGFWVQFFVCVAHQASCFPTPQHFHAHTQAQTGLALPPEADGATLKQTLGMAEHADRDSGLAVN